MKQLTISKWVLATVVAMAMGHGLALGQTNVPARNPSSTFRVGADFPVDDIVFDFDFPGGTIVEFLDLLNAARGRTVNLLIAEEDRARRIPPIQMKQITVGPLFQAMNQFGRTSPFNSSQKMDGFEFKPVSRSPLPETTGQPIWSFATYSPQDPPEVHVQFFNLEPYLVRNSVEDITTALNAGYQLKTGTNERLNLKFHKETQLLMVRGGAQELGLVAEVLKQLKPTTPANPALATQPASRENPANSNGK